MEEGRVFNADVYKKGAEVVCDACGFVIDNTAVRSREIAKDQNGFPVAEQFFECESCGKNYTVTVVDHEMMLMIQQRKQIGRQIGLHEQIRSREQTIRRLVTKDDKIKQKQIKRAKMLKERYREECGK